MIKEITGASRTLSMSIPIFPCPFSTPTRRQRHRLQRDSVHSSASSTLTSLSATSVDSGGGDGGGGGGGGEGEKRRMFTVALNKPDEILLIDTPKPIPEVVKHVRDTMPP